MKMFSIEYEHKGLYKVEYVEARTSTDAIKQLMSALRTRGMPVRLKTFKVRSYRMLGG